MDIGHRKRLELRQKLDGLRNEFHEWRKQSRSYGRLEKHHSQINRVTRQLESLLQVISKKLDVLADESSELLAAARELESMILELHRIWDFFRSKLVLRSVEWFSPYLLAADEFAWDCYSAARRSLNETHARAENIKEPPLVFFNSGASPFTVPRDWAFRLSEITLGGLKTEEFREVLKHLPIPVIGIPWFQVEHLPEGLVIGHEVGHDVEFDFGLTPRLEALLNAEMNRPGAGIDPRRQGAWRAWLSEIFADIYGTLAGGPAYVDALMDFLVAGERDIATDVRTEHGWGNYPTDYLRIHLNLRVLRYQGYQEEAERLKINWMETYPEHSMADYEADVPAVAKAILAGPYPEFGNLSLAEVISFPPHQHSQALLDAQRMLDGFKPQADNVRTIFSAARLAFVKDPEMYHERSVQSLVLNWVRQSQSLGVQRGRQESTNSEGLEKYDHDIGETLYSIISGYLSRP